MDSNMTFRIDSEVKAQMAAICDAPVSYTHLDVYNRQPW